MTDKPIKEHYEVDSDAGIMVRTFDYIADLEKYCTSIEKDLLTKIEQLSSKSQECVNMTEKAADRINELETSLSSIKETHRVLSVGYQAKYEEVERLRAENELLHKQYTELCNRNSDSDSTQDQPSDIESENDRLTAEFASLRAEKDKWKEDCIHNANRALEIVAERDKWHVLADEHSATALEFSDSLRDVRAENDRLKIDASHHAYNCDMAKRERDKAENENISLRKRCEDLEDENEKLERYINEMTSNM